MEFGEESGEKPYIMGNLKSLLRSLVGNPRNCPDYDSSGEGRCSFEVRNISNTKYTIIWKHFQSETRNAGAQIIGAEERRSKIKTPLTYFWMHSHQRQQKINKSNSKTIFSLI